MAIPVVVCCVCARFCNTSSDNRSAKRKFSAAGAVAKEANQPPPQLLMLVLVLVLVLVLLHWRMQWMTTRT